MPGRTPIDRGDRRLPRRETRDPRRPARAHRFDGLGRSGGLADLRRGQGACRGGPRSIGVIDAYRAVKRETPAVQLALIGSMASDDPEGWRIYAEVKEHAGEDPDRSG